MRSKYTELTAPKYTQQTDPVHKHHTSYSPSAYLTMTKSTKILLGHLMLDEITLKNESVWNCMKNKVTVFVADKMNTTTNIGNILGLTIQKI